MKCKTCNGEGRIREYCPVCKGSGEGSYNGSICSNCKGEGEVLIKCNDCNGTGYKEED